MEPLQNFTWWLISVNLLSVLTTILLVTSCASPAWRTEALRNSGYIQYGLWKFCVTLSSNSSYCSVYVNTGKKRWLFGARFLLSMSLLPSILHAVYLMAVFYKFLKGQRLYQRHLVSLVAPMASGCLVFGAICVFVINARYMGSHYGYAFITSVLGGVLCFTGFCIHCWFRPRSSQVSPVP